MIEKENLRQGVLMGIFLSLAIGIIISWALKPTLNSVIFILSVAMLPGFFIISLLYMLRISREKMREISDAKKFDWGIEINLKKMQILHSKYSSMLQTAGILAIGSFFTMIYLAKDFPMWRIGHQIFFPISTAFFIFFLHLAFRWWFAMRSDYPYLQYEKSRK